MPLNQFAEGNLQGGECLTQQLLLVVDRDDDALQVAFGELVQWQLRLGAVLVIDGCHDRSEVIAREWRRAVEQVSSGLEVTLVTCSARNVGKVRALGCQTLLEEWSSIEPSTIWIATTDADSRVPKDWLRAQVSQHEKGVDYWSGRVSVADWSARSLATARRWREKYDREEEPVHGANMGFNASVYVSHGGFQALKTGEDRALHTLFMTRATRAFLDSEFPVITSARQKARAPLGFAHALNLISLNAPVTETV